MQKPDGVTRWKTWLRSLLEDMFVIDAATLYCQRTRSGQLCALQQLDGATIKRVIDDWGRTPQPFAAADGAIVYPPAYQQVLKGLPAVNYSARDIIYRPRNVRAHRVYGYSPVQQVLMTVNIALRRQLWQLDYYSEGSIPDALIGVPQGWTPDQIKQFQDYWDTEFAGDLAKRRRAKFVPGDTAVKVHQTKEPEQKNDFDEWLARIICFAFSVPPQWAVKLMNRATADNQSEQAEDEGLEPTKEWVKDLVDEIIAEEFSSPDLELVWLDEDEGDPKGLEAVARRPRKTRRRHAQRDARQPRPRSLRQRRRRPPDGAHAPPATCRSRRMRVGRAQGVLPQTRPAEQSPLSENTVRTSPASRTAIPTAGSGRARVAPGRRAIHLFLPIPQATIQVRNTLRWIPARGRTRRQANQTFRSPQALGDPATR